jgi:hypothetical protein
MFKLKVILSFLLISYGLIGSAQATTLLSLSPPFHSVNVGNSIQVDLNISDLDSTLGLGAFDVDLNFDPNLMSFKSATFGTSLDVLGLGDIQSITALTGTLNLYEISLDTPADLLNFQSSSFNLVKLDFVAIGPGSTDINILVNALSDANGLAFSAETLSGQVDIASPVSEPQTFALLLVGLGLLSFVHSQRGFDEKQKIA